MTRSSLVVFVHVEGEEAESLLAAKSACLFDPVSSEVGGKFTAALFPFFFPNSFG